MFFRAGLIVVADVAGRTSPFTDGEAISYWNVELSRGDTCSGIRRS